MKLADIKAVFFDFDDTLGNREVYAYECARAILKENAEMEDPIQFEAVLQDWMLWDEKGNIKKSYIKDNLKAKYGIDLPYEDFDAYWDANLWKYTVAFEDTEETLQYLQKKYQLGVITNGPSDGQRKKLQVSGLDKYFNMDHVVVSGDYAYQKPDRRLFEQACSNLNVKPEESVYVGDIFANDILGSYLAGMTPIWIWTAGERRQNAGVQTIHHISELKQLL
jgi:putative hydrolase of the HAD superfamily